MTPIKQLSLLDVQELFYQSLFDSNQNDLIELLDLDSHSPRNAIKRLDIYRNNVLYSQITALEELYPVTRRLVGTDFFNSTANAYLHAHPPTRAAMVYFGDQFPGFLTKFKHTASLLWLYDIACLELARHQSFHAKDAVSLSASDFSGIDLDKLVDLKLALHPSIRLLHSKFPLYRIWWTNQEDIETDETIDLDSSSSFICILRLDDEVVVLEQELPAFIFLTALSARETLGNAVIAAQAIEPEFSPTKLLAESINTGFFTAIVKE